MISNESINVKGVQRLNRLRVLNLIRQNGSIVRSDIGEYSGLSPAAISGIVNYLIRMGLVVESGVENVDRTGRKGLLLHFCSERYALIVAGCEDDTLRVFLTDLSGKVFASHEHSLADCGPQAITERLCGAVRELLREPSAPEVIAFGLSMSGLVLDHGENVKSSHMSWDIPAVRKELKALRDVPFLVTNNTFTKAVWLCRGSVDEVAGVTVFVDLTHGVGASLMKDGVRDPLFIGEVGHTTVAADGEPCGCGNRGCLEQMCSPQRMLRLYRERSGKTVKDMASFAAIVGEGDPDANEVLDECAEYLGIGLATLMVLFDPGKLLINAYDYADCPRVVERACEAMRRRVFPGVGRDLHVETICFDDGDLVRAMTHELCDSLFSEQLPVDIFRQIGGE
ncbi:MAG: ROK family transcriptional regulator [Oscillospiraceae bacterium]|nr:ROK family transcriptional regulator [Oscillospiraceae bacterium]